jgi:hypothetical protein
MEPLESIETELFDFYFDETNDPRNPIMGRAIIGNASGKPLGDLHVHDWKVVVLEIGLDYIESDNADYEWYWEISIRDVKNTEIIINKHKTGFKTSYVPAGRGCSGVPTDWATYGDEVDQFADIILEDIKEHFP